MYSLVGYSLGGLEKVTRPMCALPKEKVSAGQSSDVEMLNIVQSCPESLVMGGKNKKSCKILWTSHLKSLSEQFHFYSSHSHSEVKLPDYDDNAM